MIKMKIWFLAIAFFHVTFDALGHASSLFTPVNETMTTYVTPTYTYIMIICFVVCSAAFVASIVWLMVKLNDNDRIQKENSVRPMVTPEDLENGGPEGRPSGSKLTKGVVDGKSIVTIDKKERGKAPNLPAKQSLQKKVAKSAGLKKVRSSNFVFASSKQ